MSARVDRESSVMKKMMITDGSGKKVYRLVHQIPANTSRRNYYTIPVQPPPPTSAFSTGKTILMDLDPHECGEITDIELRFSVSVSTADVELVPGPHLIKQIIVESNKIQDELARIYPETLVAYNYMLYNDEQRTKQEKAQMIHSVDFKSEGSVKYWSSSETNTIPAGRSQEITIPIPLAFFKLHCIDGQNLKHSMRFRIELSSDVVVSGDVANVSLDNIEFIVKSVELDAIDVHEKEKRQMNGPYRVSYLDCERTCYTDKTLNAGSEVRYDLSTFNGDSAFLVVVIKENPESASDKTRYDYYEVGEDGTFDLETASGQSQFGNGTAVKEELIYRNFVDETGNKYVKGMYVIPFSDNWKASLSGSRLGGFYTFYGQKDYLVIKYGSAGTAEVHTISKSGGADDGYMRLTTTDNGVAFKDLVYNTSVANIKAEIESMTNVKNRNYTVTVANDFTSASDTSVTFDTNRDGPVSKEIGVVSALTSSLNNGGTEIGITGASVTTRGKRGWSSGSGYTTEIYNFFFRDVTILPDGDIRI